MEQSILTSTKKILGLSEDYTAFDLDIATHINSTLAVLSQLGVGPVGGFQIEDADQQWDDLGLPQDQLSLAKTYVFLKTRFLFDPPSTSFLIEATERQIQEHEWRLNQLVEASLPLEVVQPVRPKANPVEEEPVW